MKHRKLRIAWSLAWATAALLLVALWVRSYRMTDTNMWRIGDFYWHRDSSADMYVMRSFVGRLYFTYAWPAIGSIGRLAVEVPIPKRADSGFGAFHNTGSLGVWMPHWLLATVAAIFSAAPWLAHARRFSLRTLLIATTLVAVGLGMIVWLSH
jgi:hypothetical protein